MPDLPATRQRRLRVAATTLDALKLASGCVDCGYRDHPAALQFDHIDQRTKTRELGWQEDRSKLHTNARLARYLDHVQTYCQVRCANCHAVRTVMEGQHTGKPVTRITLPALTLF